MYDIKLGSSIYSFHIDIGERIGPFIDSLQSALAVGSNLGFYREKEE